MGKVKLFALLRSSLAVLALALVVSVPADAASKRPAGAVKLTKKKVKKVGKVTCGQIGRKWIAVSKLPKGYYVSHAQQAKNFKKKARGKAKKKNLALSKKWAKKAKRDSLKCNPARPKVPIDDLTPHPGGPGAPGTPSMPGVPGGPLRFNIAGAAGLATRPAGQTARQGVAGTTLEAVSPTGQVTPAVTSGSANISNFMIAPSGKVYVLFAQKVNLQDTAQFAQNGCLLAEVEPSTGAPTCVDSTLSGVMWQSPMSVNKPVQFDSAGAIYYLGIGDAGKMVLRKYLNGATTDLINDNIQIDDFAVRPDATVFVSGTTSSSGVSWLRKITPQGALQSVYPGRPGFMRVFPDNNLYFGVWDQQNMGIKRYLTAENQVEAKYWFTGNVNGQVRDGYFLAEDYCTGEFQVARQSFCGSYGNNSRKFMRTTDGKMFAVAGDLLVQEYPTLEFPATAVTKVAVAQGVVTNIVLAGLNANSQNVMTILNTSNGVETPLLGPDNEIEVYHVNYSAAQNKVMFDGLRFADNKYVLGTVDMETGVASVAATIGAKWTDFQTFG